MKRIIATLLAAAALSANAQTFIAGNSLGGGIVLTLRKCPNPDAPSMFEGYAFSKTGERLGGCWALLDGLVHFVYDDGDYRIYPQDAFKQVGGSKKKSDSI